MGKNHKFEALLEVVGWLVIGCIILDVAPWLLLVIGGIILDVAPWLLPVALICFIILGLYDVMDRNP